MFQQYPQKGVNEPILLHQGKFHVRSGDHFAAPRGSASLRWLPRPGIEFDIETDEPVGIDLDSLTVELAGFRTENALAHSMNLGSTCRIRAFASEMEWGGEQPLLSAGFQAAVPGDPTAVGSGYGTIQTVEHGCARCA